MSGATTATSHKSGPGHLEVPLALATDCGGMRGKPEVIRSAVGLVPISALLCTLLRCRRLSES